MKKLLNPNTSENTIVHIAMRGSDKNEYECVGVLVREEAKSIRVGFNAKNDIIMDYLDIPKPDILSIEVMNPAKIRKLH
ncbi:hypothetical protein HKL94_01940 [Candidatus Parcubacteria bacterium]|nr:hypothetical protein [Candidatus Parcubacteria bacterium]